MCPLGGLGPWVLLTGLCSVCGTVRGGCHVWLHSSLTEGQRQDHKLHCTKCAVDSWNQACAIKKWIIQEETRSRKEETRSRKHVVHLTWLISSDTSKIAVTCSHVKQIKTLWYSIYSHFFLCSKCDLLPVFVFLLLLSFLLLKWHITHSNNLIQTSSGRVLLYQGRTLQGVFVIFKQSHFDVEHSIANSNQSPSGNNVLLTFTNL